MIQKTIILILLSWICVSPYAQDLIVKKDNSTINSKVLEISDTDIKYKKWENIDGPTYTTKKSLVAKIVYQNGSVDVFTVEKTDKKPEVKQKVPPVKPVAKPVFKKYTPQQYNDAFRKFKENKIEYLEADSSLTRDAFITIPDIIVYNATGEKVILNDYIKSNRKFAEKPTLVVTWSATWCPPCIKIIDSLLLEHKLTDKYNLVLVSRDDEAQKTARPKLYISLNNTIAFLKTTNRYSYWKNAMLLFDRDNQFENLDDNATPLLLWLDKDLKIFNSHRGFNLNIAYIPYFLGTSIEYANDIPVVFRSGIYPGVKGSETFSLQRRKMDGFTEILKTTVDRDYDTVFTSVFYYTTNETGKVIPVSNSLSNSDLSVEELERRAEMFFSKNEYQKSLEHSEAAATKGSIASMKICGDFYSGKFHGKEKPAVARNYEKGNYWYENAAKAGNVNAMMRLGDAYLAGRGVTTDHSKAVDWYKMAADKGHKYAMHYIALRYNYGGPGLKKDLVKAKEWFDKACVAGHKNSCNYPLGE